MIQYRSGYRHQLAADYHGTLPAVFRRFQISTKYFSMIDGELTIRAGYAWDGATGTPELIEKTFLFHGALRHDALYQALRMGLIPRSLRIEADRDLRDTAIADASNRNRFMRAVAYIVAHTAYAFVRKFGKKHAHEDNRRPILLAG